MEWQSDAWLWELYRRWLSMRGRGLADMPLTDVLVLYIIECQPEIGTNEMESDIHRTEHLYPALKRLEKAGLIVEVAQEGVVLRYEKKWKRREEA